MRRKTIPGQLLRLLQLISLGLLYILIKLAAKSPALVEAVYSQKVYPFIRNAVSAVTRVLPFSLAEVIAMILVTAAAILLIVRVVRLIFFRKEALVKLLSSIITIVLTCSYLVIAFYVMWGFNLYRPDVAEKLDLPEREYSVEELRAVCEDLLEHANELRTRVNTDENGIFNDDVGEMKAAVINAYTEFGASRPSFKADVPQVKTLIFPEILSRCGISGIFVFLTEEPNVNTDEPFLYTPFNAAHETAHYLGYAHEEDANFIAFLVITGSNDPALAYSGYVHALTHFAKALRQADQNAYNTLYASYSPELIADLRDYSAYYEAYTDTKVYHAAQDMNDSYLKFNGQEKGKLSYEEDVALIMRYYDSRGFFQPKASALISSVPLALQTSINS